MSLSVIPETHVPLNLPGGIFQVWKMKLKFMFTAFLAKKKNLPFGAHRLHGFLATAPQNLGSQTSAPLQT